MAVRPVPAGYTTVTPYLVVPNGAAQLAFLVDALGAEVTEKHEMPDGTVTHAAVRLGDAMVMVGQGRPDGRMFPAMIYLYVRDCDAAYAQAVKAGAEVVRAPTTQFYGDRSGAVRDAAGNEWWFATHVEDVSPEEMERRMAAAKPA